MPFPSQPLLHSQKVDVSQPRNRSSSTLEVPLDVYPSSFLLQYPTLFPFALPPNGNEVLFGSRVNKAQIRNPPAVQEVILAPCHLSFPTTPIPSTFPPGNGPRLQGLKEVSRTSQAENPFLRISGRRERKREGWNWVAFGLSQIINLSHLPFEPRV